MTVSTDFMKSFTIFFSILSNTYFWFYLGLFSFLCRNFFSISGIDRKFQLEILRILIILQDRKKQIFP